MSWRARVSDPRFRPPGRPPISRPTSRSNVQGGGPPAAQPRVPRPLAPGARRDGGPQAAAAAGAAGPSGVRRPPPNAGRAPTAGRASVARPMSAPSVRTPAVGAVGAVGPGRGRAGPSRGAARGASVAGQRGPGLSRARVVPAGRAAPTVRPRSAAALSRSGRAEPLNTSVAVRNRGGGPGRQRTLTAMAVGPQAPPGSPPRPRQVIIPAGAVDENDTTVLDVPASSPLEQPQRIIISPGTVRAEETMVVVVPAPRTLGSPQYTSPRYDPAAAAMAAAERERQEQAERVQRAKAAYLAYLSTRTDREAERLKYMLQYDQPPPAERVAPEARRVERDLWGAEMPEVPDIDVDEPEPEPEPQPYRLLMSMNIEEYPPGASGPHQASYQGSFGSPASIEAHSFSPNFQQSPPGSMGTPPWMRPVRLDEGYSDFGDLSDIEAPESLYGEDAGWEPPPPPPPLIAPPPEEENIIPQSPPRYVYQRPAPHDPEDLLWEWEEPPRPLYEIPILPEPEPYSAELFRLVRL